MDHMTNDDHSRSQMVNDIVDCYVAYSLFK